MSDKKQKIQKPLKVKPVQPPKVTVTLPPDGATEIGTEAIPSRSPAISSDNLERELKKAVKDEIVPSPEEGVREEDGS